MAKSCPQTVAKCKLFSPSVLLPLDYVHDTLEIYLVQDNGNKQAYKYRLSDEEQRLLLTRMEEYCQQQFSYGLDKLRGQYLFDQVDGQQKPQM